MHPEILETSLAFFQIMGEGTYYEILGIEANATEDDIRKAYRKQALLWHPDKNVQRKEEAEAKFKLIAEAYEVLSDPEKKQVYDLYGEEGLKNNGSSQDYDFRPNFGFQFHDPREIFNSFFNGRDPFAEMFGNQFFGGGGGFGRMPGFGTRSPFDDDDGFFSSPFGNFGPSGSSYSFSSSSSSSSSGGGQGGFVSRSISTKIINGVATTVTKTVDAQGNETVITETSDGKRQTLVNNQPREQQRAIDDGRRTTNIPIQDVNSYYAQRQQPQFQQPQFQQPQQFQQFQQYQYPQHPQQSQQYQQYQQQRSMNQQQYRQSPFQQPPFQQPPFQQQEYQDSTHPKEGDHHKKHGFFPWPHRKH
ncbi:unnamed protein product [Rhizophagus irregularis]|uniref:J domain-containing protein n=3 Tax=Rhizophagus irregularis TaxID=588596 RepID=A0A916EIS8_9GLOM|nr:unnamed protein product [Rhizophagus irregularis]CAB5195800.1 unnamed protein product [Rhizophagus irregularis]CAB5390684.1 unnamed protein product [Rhizophagus irregularis]